MQGNDHIEKEGFDLEKEAPALSGVDRKDGFKVPDGYFDDLQDRISARMKERRPSHILVRPAFYVPAAAAAAIACIGLYIGLFSQHQADQIAPVHDLADASSIMEAEDVLMDDVLNTTLIEDEEIIDALMDGEMDLGLTENPILAGTLDAETQAVRQTDEEIITYLVDYDVNLEDIIDELKTVEL